MKSKGFTLLELVIASGAAMVIGTLLMTIWVNNNGVFYKQNSLVNEGLTINDVTQKIEEYARQAVNVPGGYPESSPTYITGGQVLVLKLPAINSSGVIADTYDYVVVTPDSSKPKILRLMVFPDSQSTRPPSNTVLSSYLQSIQFSYLDVNSNPVTPTSAVSVGINLTVLSKLGSVGSSQNSSTTVSLRNAGK